MLIGVISDTHGYLHPDVPKLLSGVEHILHAGDIGDDTIIQELGKLAPVTVVRGNNDRTGPESLYPEEVDFDLDGHRFYLTHQVKPPKRPTESAMQPYIEKGIDVVVYGHSHIAFNERIGGVLFFNPGAAGKRRFKVVPSIGLLELSDGHIDGTIVPL